MSLQRLRTFVEVYRQRSISGAARSLGLTQPAVSQHLAGLEATIGRKLFERTASGVVPAIAAEELAAQIGDTLDAAEAALASVRARSQELAGAIQIAGHVDFLAEVAGPVFPSLLEQGLRIRLHSGNRAKIEAMLLDGQCDLGVSAYPVHDRRLRGECVGEVDMIAVASPPVAARLNAQENLVGALVGEPAVAYGVDRPILDEWMHHNGMGSIVLPPPAIAGQDLRGLCRLLRGGFGWSVMPDYICARYLARGELAAIQAPVGNLTQQYFVIWTPSALREPRIAHAKQALIQQLRDAIGKERDS
jgi:DNA-binding transcriptional LysR family regulator